MYQHSLEFARQSDALDPLKDFREKFIIPSINSKEQIYFLGNSLGLQPKNAKEELNKILDQWGQYGVEGFFNGDQPWLDYHDKLTKSFANIVCALRHYHLVIYHFTINL